LAIEGYKMLIPTIDQKRVKLKYEQFGAKKK
jgi:hypothetical protein